MNIRNEIAENFRTAIADPRNSTKGTVDYHNVCASVLGSFYLSGRSIEKELGSLEEFFTIFNSLVELELALEAA